jgi:hypothetical protein
MTMDQLSWFVDDVIKPTRAALGRADCGGPTAKLQNLIRQAELFGITPMP